MFSFLKKKTPKYSSEICNLRTDILTLKGLHCSSCAIDIDLTLEELPSVVSTTNYARSETKIRFDPSQTSLQKIKSVIADLGYQVI
jgi:copper chaperone CopZ